MELMVGMEDQSNTIIVGCEPTKSKEEEYVITFLVLVSFVKFMLIQRRYPIIPASVPCYVESEMKSCLRDLDLDLVRPC